MSSQGTPNASRLRTSCRATSRRASSAPRRSNLLTATASAKSSMSIFSSWEAAPNSGVMTYSETSLKGTIAASPCPMPGVSTMTRSNPAAFTAVRMSSNRSGSCAPADRVAIDRKKVRFRSPLSRAFILIRSPSRAPPPRRRVGSIASTAMRSLSSKSIAEAPQQLVGQRRLTGPARSGDAEHGNRLGWQRLPDTLCQAGGPSGLEHGDRTRQRSRAAAEHGVQARLIRAQVDVARRDQLVDHAGQAQPLPVLRREDRYSAVSQQGDLLGHDDAAAAPVHLDVTRPELGEPLHKVAEVLDVPTLVGRQGDALRIFLDRGACHYLDTAVVPEVDHLRALALQHPPHDVDRRVVAIEQACGGDEPHGVDRHVERRGITGHCRLRCGCTGPGAVGAASRWPPSQSSRTSYYLTVILLGRPSKIAR